MHLFSLMAQSIQTKFSAKILYIHQRHNKMSKGNISVLDGPYALLDHNQLYLIISIVKA